MAAPIVINVTQGSETKGLRLKSELVDLFDLDPAKITNILLTGMSTALYSTTAVSQMIIDNIEEID